MDESLNESLPKLQDETSEASKEGADEAVSLGCREGGAGSPAGGDGASADAYWATTLDDRRVPIPRAFDPACEGYPPLADGAALRAYFAREGYVVVRGLVDPALCDAAQAAFEAEVKPHGGRFRRHESGRMEPHVFTPHGHMKYPIMNLQDLAKRSFPRFRQAGLDVLTHPGIQQVMQCLFGEPGRLIHTMYFEGNQVTWAHQDAAYIDSEQEGGMVGVWVAAEDIAPEAGRFYVCPGSHRLGLVPVEEPNGAAYKTRMLELIRSEGLTVRAPALRKGDALFFCSLVIHGSLRTDDERYSRRSFTAHYLSQSHTLVRNRTRRAELRSEWFNGTQVCLHDDQNRLKVRLAQALEVHAPDAHRFAKSVLRVLRGPGR